MLKGIYLAMVNAPRKCNISDPLCPNRYFSDSYTEARDRFIEYSSKIHNSIQYHLPIDIPNDIHSETNETLCIDITVVNPNAKQSDHLLIHISGINGVEGFAGSAIQCAMLSEMAINQEPSMSSKVHKNEPQRLFENDKSKKSKDSKPSTLWKRKLINHHGQKWKDIVDDQHSEECNVNDFPTVIFVHGLNPYGMSRGVRSNENGVNLNRNFNINPQGNQRKKVNALDQPINDEIDRFLNPQYDIRWMIEVIDRWFPFSRFFQLDWVIEYVWTYVVDWYLRTRLIGYYFLNHQGMNSTAVWERYIKGQSHDSYGLQYVGNEEIMEKSHVVFQEFLKTQFIENEWRSQFKKVTLIDVHTTDTQLTRGRSGLDVITVLNEEDLTKMKRLGGQLKSSKIYGDGMNQKITGMSYGYIDWIQKELMDDKVSLDHLSLMQSFGTYSREYILSAERMYAGYSKEYRMYLDKVDRDDEDQMYILKLLQFMEEYARGLLMDAFYPRDLGWKRQVVAKGHDAFCALYRR